MEKDGACKMERQNGKCSCVRKSGRRKNNASTDEEEKKLTEPLAKKELPAEGCSWSIQEEESNFSSLLCASR